jgi:hypothetical protein
MSKRATSGPANRSSSAAAGFLVPPDYEGYFNQLPDDDLIARLKSWAGIPRKGFAEDLFAGAGRFDRTSLIHDFLNKAATHKAITGQYESLSEGELDFLLDCVQKGGVIPVEDNPVLKGRTAQDLEDKALLVRLSIDRKPHVVLPLEVFLIGTAMLQASSAASRRLLFFIYRCFTVNLLRYIVSQRKITLRQNHKLAMAVAVYCDITISLRENCRNLTGEEMTVIRWLMACGGMMSAQQFAKKAEQGNRRRDYWSHYDDHPLNQFLREPQRCSVKLWKEEEALVQLLCKGIVGFSGEGFSVNYDYWITQEAYPWIGEWFFRDLEEERAGMEQRMYVSAPKDSLDFSGRVCGDLIKVQIAAMCGLTEVTQKSEIKKKSVREVSRLLSAPEPYIGFLLGVFPYIPDRQHPDRWTIEQVEFDSYKIIRAFFSKSSSSFWKSVLPVLLGLSGWVRQDRLIQYIFASRECFLLQSVISPEEMPVLLTQLVFLGMMEMSLDGGCLRPTEVLTDLLSGKKMPVIPVIPAKDQPLIIQPNLELLVPFNCEPTVFQRLCQFAELAVLDNMLHFRLTKESLMRGVDRKWTAEQVKALMISLCPHGVPPTVENFIHTVLSRQGEAVVFSCETLIRCAAPGLKERILAINPLGAFSIAGIMSVSKERMFLLWWSCSKNIRLWRCPAWRTVFLPASGKRRVFIRKRNALFV